jgi:hypothetical protein
MKKHGDNSIQDEDDSRSPSLARAAIRHSVSDQEGSNDSSVEEEEGETKGEEKVGPATHYIEYKENTRIGL